MFLKLWNFLRGYVIIQVSGFSVERFINLAVHKGVFLWNIKYSSNFVSMCVSIRGYKQLKDCAKKTKCRFKIIKKCGRPFIAHRYRKRKALVIGLLFFIFALYFLSSFIWVVEIEGNKRVKRDDVLSVAYQCGVRSGSFKRLTDVKKLTQVLIKDFPDISWAAVEITGTLAKISIVETIPKPEIIDKSIPVDIVAKSDGIIASIVASSGTPIVTPNDVVRAGDVLIGGTVVVKEGENEVNSYNIHASGIVRAKLIYELSLSEYFEYTTKVYTNNIKKDTRFSIFENKFNFLKAGISFDYYDKVTNEKFLDLGFGLVLPVTIATDEYLEYHPEKRKHTAYELKKILTEKVDLKLQKSLDENAEIIDKKLMFSANGDSMSVDAVITTIERIDEERQIR